MYPLSLIASLMSHPDTECAHVIKYLRNVDIRMKTYPKEWLERCSGDDTTLANPESLAEAGFYCNAWLHSRSSASRVRLMQVCTLSVWPDWTFFKKKVLVNEFCNKSSPKVWSLFGPFWKHYFLSKTALATFRNNLWNDCGYLFQR